MSTELERVWKDQAVFNARFRPFPSTYEAKCEQTRDLILEITDELHELLRTTVWKKHRNGGRMHPENLAHTTEEIVDAFKYLVSLAQIWGMTPDDLLTGYWRKSAVCEQRYVEEWVSALARKEPLSRVAFVDLDNVIFDYIRSFGGYILEQFPLKSEFRDRITTLVEQRAWLSAQSTGVDHTTWEALKHTYRVSGRKAYMALMPGAKEFLQALRSTDHVIVIVTSRPIDRYPNLMTDTVAALNHAGLPYDHIWHGMSKKTALVERLTDWPANVFAVDDDLAYVKEYASLSMPVFHVTNGAAVDPAVYGIDRERVFQVQSLTEIVEQLGILA